MLQTERGTYLRDGADEGRAAGDAVSLFERESGACFRLHTDARDTSGDRAGLREICGGVARETGAWKMRETKEAQGDISMLVRT